MGYRSDITVAFVFENQTAVNMFSLTVTEPNYAEIIEDLQTMEWSKDPGEDGLIYAVCHLEGYKWYPDYTYVKQFTELLNLLDESFNTCIGAKFVRAGEDSDDVDEIYYGWQESVNGLELYTQTVTTIHCDVGGAESVPNPLQKAQE